MQPAAPELRTIDERPALPVAGARTTLPQQFIDADGLIRFATTSPKTAFNRPEVQTAAPPPATVAPPTAAAPLNLIAPPQQIEVANGTVPRGYVLGLVACCIALVGTTLVVIGVEIASVAWLAGLGVFPFILVSTVVSILAIILSARSLKRRPRGVGTPRFGLGLLLGITAFCWPGFIIVAAAMVIGIVQASMPS